MFQNSNKWDELLNETLFDTVLNYMLSTMGTVALEEYELMKDSKYRV
jgi:hypothetical protein